MLFLGKHEAEKIKLAPNHCSICFTLQPIFPLMVSDVCASLLTAGCLEVELRTGKIAFGKPDSGGTKNRLLLLSVPLDRALPYSFETWTWLASFPEIRIPERSHLTVCNFPIDPNLMCRV
jgi:hypothetical protein